jgi:mono/diheme cytochrome c family protein
MTTKYKSMFTTTVMLLLISSTLSAQGMMMDHSPYRHHQSMRGGIPAPYSNAQNPLPASKENLERGAELFQNFCATCHGSRGQGDGPAGKALKPRPANLARFIRMPMLSRDSYLMWTISDGGVQFQTAMPSFKTSINEQDRWRIIHFLRTL